jgi:uncharacterized membrane-anchored protein
VDSCWFLADRGQCIATEVEDAGFKQGAEVTFAFWLIKIARRRLARPAGMRSMTLQLGYAISTAIFFSIFLRRWPRK